MNDPALSVELADLRSENERLRRAKQLRESYGIHFYRPHVKQHRFHETGQITGRYARFGNRTGKTTCGAAEDVAWLLGGRVWYEHDFDIPGRREIQPGVWEDYVAGHHDGCKGHPLVQRGIPQRPVKGLLIGTDWDKLKEIFTNRAGSYSMWGDLFQLLPAEAVGKPHLSRGGHIDLIPVKRLREFGGGESVLYLDTIESFKHSWLSAESSDYDFVHFDEPPPHDMFIALMRGLADRHGKFWVNATPKAELWVNDEFCPPGGTNYKVPPEGLTFNKEGDAGLRYIITASIYENPFIDDQGRADFAATLNREQKECMLHGLPLNLAGLIYKEFIYDLHVLADVPKGWKSFADPPAGYTVRVAWDVHDAIPQAVLLVATAPTGETFVYDEIFDSKLVGTTAEQLKSKLSGRFVADYLIDPRAVIESPVTGESILDELINFDLFFEKGSKDMELGISKTREKLLERSPQGFPTIWFAPTVPQLIHEITRYAYNPRTLKPVDKDDHMVENLRRLVLTGLSYVEPLKASDYVRTPRNISLNELALR